MSLTQPRTSTCLFSLFFLSKFSEEVISDNHAVWWSGDGAALLYASFNDTFVEDYSFPMYGPFEDVYTTIIEIPYPKVHVCISTLYSYIGVM